MNGIVRMRTIAFTPDRVPTLRRIRLGYEGDNLVERLEFDLPEIAAGQTATLMITGADAVKLDRTDEGRYAVDLTRDMIGPDGEREAYVRIDGAGEKVWKSAPMRMVTGALPDVEEEIEKQYPTAVGQMLTAMAEHSGEMQAQEERVEQAAQRAEEAAERAEAGGGGGGSGAPGKDGGYYQPSVTDGVLSWTPSNGDMPSVPASDVRGPAGQDGQPGKDGKDGSPGAPGKTAYQYAQDGGYTGTEAEFAEKLAQEIPEPYTLPVATAERLGGMMVGDGLMADEDGRVSVKPEGKYELITTLNNEKEVSNIWITQGKDGNPLRLKRAIVKVLVPVSDVEFYLGVYVTFTSGQAMRAVGLCDAKNATMGYRVECYPRNGFYTLRGYYPYRGYSNVYMSLAEANAESCAFSDEYAIKQITINIAGGNVNGVPVGTTIELQGVLE